MPATNVSKLRRDARQAGAMHELLAPCAFFGDAVLTKCGDLFFALRLAPIDPECLDPEAVATICHRVDAALRILGPEYRIYQYLLKRSNPELALSGGFDEPLRESRARWLGQRREQLYSVHLFLVLLQTRR